MLGTLKPLSQEQRQQYLPKEVPATLQLYLDGKMEQFWLRDKEEGTYLPDEPGFGRRGGPASEGTTARSSQLNDLRPDADRTPATPRHVDEGGIATLTGVNVGGPARTGTTTRGVGSPEPPPGNNGRNAEEGPVSSATNRRGG
jgi:hypothetical protein